MLTVPYTRITCQVKAEEHELKHKLWPESTFLKATGLNLPAAYPWEELHRFLLGLYWEFILPATLYVYTHWQVLRDPALFKTPDSPLVTDALLRAVWTSLMDRLSSWAPLQLWWKKPQHMQYTSRHIYWQAHRKAHGWRQDKNIASVIALSTQRPH